MKVLNVLPQGRPTFDVLDDYPAPLICFSHLRWDFVFQRPQHLMSRFARERRVYVFEEPIACDHHRAYLEYHPFPEQDVIALRPRVPHWWDEPARQAALREMLAMLIATQGSGRPILWFYTPMMYGFARHVDAALVVYDCMDELAAFSFAPPELKRLEADLLQRADVVFTGGHSLYEAKRGAHDNIHPFPSSVDVAHFHRARETGLASPADQADIPHPRLGFYGVIDERMDLALLDALAGARPDWHIVMIGPVAKIDPAALPRRPNLHYLGPKSYDELPAYLAGWDVALMPFAINASTRFISPTKTPEYLAAGRPVVSTPITDVERHYGHLAGVAIAATGEEFVEACAAMLQVGAAPSGWRPEADRLLAGQSWDDTFGRMRGLVGAAMARQSEATHPIALSPLRAPCKPAYARPGGASLTMCVVAGAGFAGAVLAERLAAGSGRRVLIVDRRPHVGGNAYDHFDRAGILVHRYGPHIFHTNARDVVDYLSRFTEWRPYEHRVLASVGDALVPMPINRTTLNALFGLDLRSDAEARGLPGGAGRARRSHPHGRGCRGGAGGSGTLRDVLPRLHPQAMGPRSVRTRPLRHPAGPDPDLHGRPLLRRRVPDDAGPRLHGHVRCHAGPSQHHGPTRCRVRRRPARRRRRPYGVHGPDRRIFRPLLTAPLPYRSLEFRHETHERRRFQTVGVVNYPSEDRAVHADHRI